LCRFVRRPLLLSSNRCRGAPAIKELRCYEGAHTMKLRSLPSQAAVLGVFIALVAACAGTNDDANSPENVEAAAKDTFIADYCAITLECCNKVLSLPKDEATCRKRVATLDPAMLANAQARTDCLAQLRRQVPLADFCTEFGNLDQPSCPDLRRKELIGKKAIGEGCATTAECAPSFLGTVACKSVCQVTKRGKEGEGPCVATIDGDSETRLKGDVTGSEIYNCYLRDELVCDPTEKKCIKPVTSSGECTDSTECVVGFYCNEDTELCEIRRSNGSACDDDEQCQGTCEEGFCESSPEEGGRCATTAGCDEGLVCSAGKCAPALPDSRLDGACVDR
jgi:hypothetical protein